MALEYTVIRPRSKGLIAQLADIRNARFMLWNLIKSSALVPYADLSLGVFWTFIRPLIFVAVIVFVRNKSNANMGETVPYALYVFSGLIVWWYFVDATKQSGRSLYKYRSLLTKVYYPRLITPVVPVIARLLDLIFQFFAAIPFMVYFNCFPGYQLLWLPLLLINLIVLSLGLGMLFSVLSAAVKDFERVLDFFLYVAFFMSPVIFSTRIIDDEYKTYYAILNPMSGPLEAIRAIMFNGVKLDLISWSLSGVTALVVLVLGLFVFSRYEERLAEMVS